VGPEQRQEDDGIPKFLRQLGEERTICWFLTALESVVHRWQREISRTTG
jgi:hypothetical protein